MGNTFGTRGLLAATRRWRYRLEKGHPHAIGLVLLIGILGGAALIGGAARLLSGDTDTLGGGVWWAFLHLTDSGYLGDDESAVGRLLGSLMTFVGLVFLTSMLIAGSTSFLTTSLARIQEGGFDVAFDNHTVILGWNPKVFALVRELLLADEHVQIAILAGVDKREADDALETQVFQPFDRETSLADRLQPWRDKRRLVVYRRGNIYVDSELQKVGAARAGRFVLLAPEASGGIHTDVQMLRTYLSLQSYRRRTRAGGATPGQQDAFRTVIEITRDRFRSHTFLAANLDPRADSWVHRDLQFDPELREYLPDPHSDHQARGEDLTLVNGDELVSRALVQCAVQPRLSQVFNTLLSHEGADFHILDPAAFGTGHHADLVSLFEKACKVEHVQLPAFLARHLVHGLIVGVYGRTREDEEATSPLGFETTALHAGIRSWRDWFQAGRPVASTPAPLLVLGKFDRNQVGRGCIALQVTKTPRAAVAHAESAHRPAPEPRSYRVLVLGYNRRVSVLIEQFSEYCRQYDWLDLEITIVAPDLDEAEVHNSFREVAGLDTDRQTATRQDFSDWKVLGGLLRESGEHPFDTIVLLAADTESTQQADARVILGIVMLRAFRTDPRWRMHMAGTHVVAELLDPLHANVVETNDWVSDVLISNQYVSRFMGQVSTEHRVEEIFREILDYGDREIYVRPLEAIVAEVQPGARFLDAIEAAAQQGEVAIGYTRAPQSPGGAGVHLAPDPDTPLAQVDKVIVIADD
ncbi:MAG: hypothetical protein GY913_25615 [Proteobacteria bacterium]|nr:hypothetical protein [Pseudomonadota bacterium]MCP4920293.1 hypothetical protein [Pseudomonadota bacterium]